MPTTDPTSAEYAELANRLFSRGKYEEALEKYRVMANAGSIEAQMRVGWMYHLGYGIGRNLDEARRWYEKAAERNSPEAQFYLGTVYRQMKLYDEAFAYFQKSAAQNYAPAIYELGAMYDLGEGRNKDIELAYEHYKRAARMGNLRAQREIAVATIKGRAGLKQIPIGVFLLFRLLYQGLTTAVTNPESDRMRW